MNWQVAAITGYAAFALEVVGGLSSCGHYEEPLLSDPSAMPPRREVSPPNESGVGVITGDVRVETLAASEAVAFETVGLFQDGKLLATSTTDGHGRFRFEKSGPGLYDDGIYELSLLSDRYRGSSRIQYARFSQRPYTLRATLRGSP